MRECTYLNLILCPQIVEVSMLNAHYLHDCDQKEDMKKCPKCRQAVVISEFAEHKDGCKGMLSDV